jgi:hypothetical protein
MKIEQANLTIPPGVYFQLYTSAIPDMERKLPYALDKLKGYNVPGVILHHFPEGMAKKWWSRFKSLGQQRELLVMPSWGMDGDRENNGTQLTATEKGNYVGEVLADPDCPAGIIDAEGQWDSDRGPQDEMDERGALDFGLALRKKAPCALVASQEWFAIDSHGGARRNPKVIEEGGPWAGFPIDEFAAYAVNWVRAVQAYSNHASYKASFGTSRFKKIHDWKERDWKVANDAMAKVDKDLVLPVSLTLQGYGWDDCPWWLVWALVEYTVVRELPVFIWCDWYPTDTVIRCVLAAQKIQAFGRRPNETTDDLIGRYQEHVNALVPAAMKLEVDKKIGPKWLALFEMFTSSAAV